MTADDIEMAPATETTEVPSSPAAVVTNSKKRKTSVPEIAVDLSLPEPPSKKAKRLLKKGKALPPKPASDDEGGADTDDPERAAAAAEEAKKKAAKKERSPYGVWIGNLRFHVTRQQLREWLVANSGGVITDELITRVHMPSNKPEKKEKKEKRVGGRKKDDEDGEGEGEEKKGAQNKGFAYVDFATLEANVAAIALSENDLGGRKVLIKDAKSYEGRPAKVEPEPVAADPNAAAADKKGKKAVDENASTITKVFVGNLSFNTTEDELWAHFEKCGPIRWVKVATFEDTGKCKGYGWVNFQEPEAAQWASKGFVKIKETIETIEDFMDEGKEAVSDDEEAGGEGKTQLVRREKVRKWWVNQLNGRQLKLELAEDDQSRYKKRFGKDRPERKTGEKARPQKTERKAERSWKDRREEDNAADPGPLAPAPAVEAAKKAKEPTISYHDDIQVARMTGAAVKPQGKKVTFD
ncbi:RNA-binding protein rnp24-like protein [Coniochaeta sp. 2T2.1]|nr:RNA-binding protein rnp24-like protein [Coniochaeta sp. 2T2.1]